MSNASNDEIIIPESYDHHIELSKIPEPYPFEYVTPLPRELFSNVVSVKAKPMMRPKAKEPREQSFSVTKVAEQRFTYNEDADSDGDTDEGMSSHDGINFNPDKIDKLHAQRTVKFKAMDQAKPPSPTKPQPISTDLVKLMKENKKLQAEKVQLINDYEEKIKRITVASQKELQKSSMKKSQSMNLSGHPQEDGFIDSAAMEKMLMEEIKLMSNEIEDLKMDNDELREENEQLRVSHEKAMTEYKDKIVKLQQQILSLEGIDSYVQKLKKSEDEKSLLFNELAKLRKERADLKEQLSKTSVNHFEVDSVKARLNAMTAEKNYYEKELKNAKTLLVEAEKAMKSRDAEIENLKVQFEQKMVMAKYAQNQQQQTRTPQTDSPLNQQQPGSKQALKSSEKDYGSNSSSNNNNQPYESPFQDVKFDERLLESFQTDTAISSMDNSFIDNPAPFGKNEIIQYSGKF